MVSFKERYGYHPNDDEFMQGLVDKPLYMVSTGKFSMPFHQLQHAKDWQEYLMIVSDGTVDSVIIDLTGYDWDENPRNIKIHRLPNKQSLN